ncbi:hypothetical protein PQX77_019201 [Marasmius sp. AFHP31]|nr:hypothetical protein PQX77_019201 [Marasmius sp. AFHP31]
MSKRPLSLNESLDRNIRQKKGNAIVNATPQDTGRNVQALRRSVKDVEEFLMHHKIQTISDLSNKVVEERERALSRVRVLELANGELKEALRKAQREEELSEKSHNRKVAALERKISDLETVKKENAALKNEMRKLSGSFTNINRQFELDFLEIEEHTRVKDSARDSTLGTIDDDHASGSADDSGDKGWRIQVTPPPIPYRDQDGLHYSPRAPGKVVSSNNLSLLFDLAQKYLVPTSELKNAVDIERFYQASHFFLANTKILSAFSESCLSTMRFQRRKMCPRTRQREVRGLQGWEE